MGVDLAVYRSRVGQFVSRHVDGSVSNIDYLCKAIASVRGSLKRQDRLNSEGAVTFINLLLRAQGIEPNPGPGPGKTGEHSSADTPTDDNDNINITLDSNSDSTIAEMSNVMGLDIPGSNPSDTGSSQTTEYAGAVAIPGSSFKVIVKSTDGPQNSNSDSTIAEMSNVMGLVIPGSNPSDTGSSQTTEYAGAVAIPGSSSGAIVKSAGGSQMLIYVDQRKYHEEIHVQKTKVKNAENVCAGEQTVLHTAPTDNEDDSIPKPKKKKRGESEVQKSQKRTGSEVTGEEDESVPESKKMKNAKEAIPKSSKRVTLEENTEIMLKRHIKETENLLVTRTEAVTAVVKRLKDYNMVVIAGVTGEGKTTLGREICKQLRDGTLDKDIKPKTPVLMTIPQDWNDVVNDKDDIVVFVDDIFGKTNYQTGLLNDWKPFFDRILQCLHEKNVCLVVTSRTHILKDARRDSGVLIEMVSDHILSERKTVDLTEDHKLSTTERTEIYKNYQIQRQTDHDSISRELLPFSAVYGFPSKIAIGFAQICKLFFTNDTFYQKGEHFFTKPDRILTEEIETMRQTEPHKYFALVYCFIEDKAVDTKKLDRLKVSPQEYDNLKIYAEVCGVLQTDNVLTLLKNALDALAGTYLTKRNTAFTFGHQTIADSVCIVFGKENPEMVLEKCSNRVILEMLDVSETDQTDMCTLHVPSDCFEHLVKRMYKMIIQNGNTLESFPRFRNQKLADCLFEYITTSGDIQAFHIAHSGMEYFSTRSVFESCANNVFFLKALFKFKVDEFIVKENGILFYTRTLHATLLRSIEYKNRACTSLLLANGAFLTEKCLHDAICSNDVELTELVLSKNIWVRSEISRCIKPDTTEHLRDILERETKMPDVHAIWNCYRNQKLYKAPTKLSQMSAKDISTAIETMDFDRLQTILQSPDLKTHHSNVIKSVLAKGHKDLNDAVSIKRIGAHIDVTVVQHALHLCDLDMFRFLLFSSKISTSHLNSVLSEAIHLNQTNEIEVLIKAGGQPSLEDLIYKAGATCMDVECVVETILTTSSWTSAQLDRALDAAVRSGTHATMKVLIKGEAHFAEDALVNVSKRLYCPLVPYQCKLPASFTKLLKIDETTKIVLPVNVTVQYVFSEHEWSQNQINDALDAALVSGSETTVQFMRVNGGTFRSNALLAAVRRRHFSLQIVGFVRKFGEWSVDQLSDALHEAIVICRPDFIVYLNNEGAVFNDSSLRNVLRWKVEQHIQIKLIKHILEARPWKPSLLDEAVNFACEAEGLAILASLPITEARPESLTRNVLLKLRETEKKKKWVIQKLKSQGMDADLALVLDNEIREGCTDIVEHLICELGISCCNDGLSNAMDNTRNYQNFDRLKMVRLVRESKDWPDELLTKALDKVVRLGYSDVMVYLHKHGAKFSNESLENAMLYKNTGYDPYDLVSYVMKSRHYSEDLMTNALTTSLEIGHYQIMIMFHEKGTQFADKSLQQAIHKGWTPSDRLPAAKFILNARRWDNTEKNEALHRAVKFGDISIIACLLNCGGEVSTRCLSEILEKKCKPSHRLCIVRLLLSSPHSLARPVLEEAGAKARQMSEPKLEAFIQQCIK